jgi:hypothetical protein
MEGAAMPRALTPEEIEMLQCETTRIVEEPPLQFTAADSDGVLFDKLKNQILCYPAVKKDTSYSIPACVTSIGNHAFADCESLASITLPVGITSIGNVAFGNCESLTAINIPASVTTIGGDVFLGCERLSITVEKQNPRFSDIDGVLFDKIEKRILFSTRKKEGSII